MPQYDYLMINDGSKDETVKICRDSGYNLMDLPVNLGLAGVFQAGMHYAYEHEYVATIQIGGDGKHDPRYILQMMQELENGECDLVIGSRFATDKHSKSLRMFGNTLLEMLIKLTTGQRLGDPTSGVRLFGPKVIRRFATEMNYGPEPDTVCYLMRSGIRVKEVQAQMRKRIAVGGYLNLTRSMIYMLHMFVSILFIQWFRERGMRVCRLH